MIGACLLTKRHSKTVPQAWAGGVYCHIVMHEWSVWVLCMQISVGGCVCANGGAVHMRMGMGAVRMGCKCGANGLRVLCCANGI